MQYVHYNLGYDAIWSNNIINKGRKNPSVFPEWKMFALFVLLQHKIIFEICYFVTLPYCTAVLSGSLSWPLLASGIVGSDTKTKSYEVLSAASIISKQLSMVIVLGVRGIAQGSIKWLSTPCVSHDWPWPISK